MNSPADSAALPPGISPLVSMRLLDCVSFAPLPPGASGSGWPARPGAVSYGIDGNPQLLHYAPGRWLAVATAPPAAVAVPVVATFDAVVANGNGVQFDVSGKWQAFGFADEQALRLLASTIDLTAALAGRDCAALTLFDCPALLARVGSGAIVWVGASYAQDFTAGCVRAAAALLHRRN